jgi:hypothetical protein
MAKFLALSQRLTVQRTPVALAVMMIIMFVPFMAGCVTTQHYQTATDGRFEFGVIGDQEYTAEDEAKFPRLINLMNNVNLAFVAHVGDFQGDYNGYKEGDGSPPCTDETMAHRKQMFQTSKHPLVVTPGDNEWTDCHKRKVNSFDPLERLAKVREIFFPSDQSLGQRTISLTQQHNDPKYSKYRENARWTHGNLLFVTLHIVGSNNNLGRTREMDTEYAERNAANLAWMKEAFDLGKRNDNKGLVILTQANPAFENFWASRRFGQYMRVFQDPLHQIKPEQLAEIRKKSGYTDLVQLLETKVMSFGKPVLFVHGDSHVFRVDKPLFNTKTAEP